MEYLGVFWDRCNEFIDIEKIMVQIECGEVIFFISFDKLIEVFFVLVCKFLFKTNDIKYI